MSGRRRDDRPHDDRYKVWAPQDKQPDRDHDRRRHRSATVPSQTHDPRSQPPDNKPSSRAYRQEPHYNTTAPSTSNQPPPAPSSSRTFHPPRSAAQNPSAAYHVSTPYQTPTPIQPPQVPQTSKGYSAAAQSSSSRRAQPDNIDSRSYQNRRAPTAPILKSSYDHGSAEDAARSSRQPSSSRTIQPSTQTMPNASTSNWPSSTQDAHVKRSKDRDKERDRYRELEKERNRERNVTELDRYRERYRSELHREKDKGVETEKQREPSRFRSEKKMESDSEGLVYPDNASKASLSGREYQPSVRESNSGHRRQRTEDGPSSSTARRNQTDPSHYPMYMQSTGPQAAAATGSNTPGVGSNPPPAPRVMPVYLPQKPSKSHQERHAFSAAHGGQSSSDAERASVKHRMERNPSGAPVQRGDAYTSSAVKERQGQEGPAGPREDTRSKSEAKYSSTQGAYYNSRPPLQPASVNTVDIPLVTPGFNSSPLPHESRGYVGTIPVLVAGEGPADRQTHDTLYKPQTASRRDELQDARYPHVSHASVGKPSLGRSQSSEVPHSRSEIPPLDRSRTDPAAVNLSHDRHYRPNDHVPPQNTSRYPQFTNMAVEPQPSQPRSTHKISFSNPPTVSGPRPQPSSPCADNQNESTRPVTATTPAPGPMTRVASTQPSVPPSPAHKINSSPSRNGSAYGFLPSAHTGTHGSNATSIKRSPSTPPPTPMTSSQTMMNASQPYTRHAPHPNEPPSRTSLDRPEPHVVAPRMTTTQVSNGGTVKSSWVVQTAQADMQLKNGYPAREEKYSARNGSHQPVDPSAVAHPQLREVLSQDNHHPPAAHPRAAPTQGSPKRPSPHGTPKDVHAAGPRRTPDSSPRMLKVKEPVMPEQTKPPPFPPPALGPPQIAVIRATPSSVNEELPHRSHYNTGLLAPAYPAPSRVSKTTPDSPLRISRTTSGSGSRDYQTPAQTQIAHTHPVTSTASYQQTPVLPQPVSSHAPQSSSYGYGQYASNTGGQFSPPPLPVPPPSSYGQSASNAGGQFSPPPLPVPPPRMPGVDIAEDIFPVKVSSSSGPTGSNPARPSPAVSWQPTQAAAVTPASTPSIQPHTSNGHVDSYKNKPWASEGMGAKPTTSPYQKAAAVPPSPREAVATAPVEARTMPSSSAGATGFANGVSQDIPGSQHPPPQSQGPSAGSYPLTHPVPQLKRKVTIEEVPESPMFANQRPPSLPQTNTPTQPSETPIHSSSVPAAKAQPSEANTPRATPPSKTKDVPAHTPVRPPITPTQSYPPPASSTQHPTYAPASSRLPSSAPPMQSSFSSSYVDALHRSTFSAQPRGYPARPTPTSTSESIAAAQPVRSASQPLTIAQSAILDAASRVADTHAKLQSSRPPVSAPAQATRPFGQPLSAQSALLDAAARGKQFPTTTVAAPQPQSLPTAETNPQYSRPTTSASGAAAQATGRQQAATSTATAGTSHPQSLPTMESHANPHSSRPTVPPVTIPQGPSARAAATPTVTSQVQDAPIPNDSVRSRGFLSSFSRNASAAMNPIYPATHRQPTPAISNQQSKQPPPPMHSNSHHRTVSLPTPKPISTSNANSRPPSPRKPSQPLVNSSATSTQPFPTTSSQAKAPSHSAKTADSSWASRVAVSGYPSTPRAHLPSAINRALSHESEVLLTPSSIAPSMPKTPQMTFNSSVSHATASPMRQRQVSTDSRESKKKSGGFLGGFFRTKSGSSRPLESPVIAPSPVKTFIGGAQKSPAVVAPPVQYPKSSSSAKESKEKITATAPPAPAAKIQVVHTAANPPTSTSVQPKAPAPKVKTKAKVPDPAVFLQPSRPSRDQKPPSSSNVFSPFSFLTSKRKRTMSGASLDVCDGNTATNTAVGSPYINQAQQLPPVPPPPVRDPMRATGEWRDKTEEQQQKRKKNRPRPGVTFDVEEDPPSPYPGRQKGARLVRRKSGRTSTPGPTRG